MNKFNLNIILFILPITLLGFLNIIVPKTQTVSEIENRSLKSMPELTLNSIASGDYFRDFESYFADHFLMRENLVSLGMGIRELKGVKTKDEVSIVTYDGANIFESQMSLEEEIEVAILDEVKIEGLDDSFDNEKTETYMTNETETVNEPSVQQETPVEEVKPIEKEALSEKEPSSENQENIEKKVGSVLIVNNKIMEIFTSSEAGAKAYAGVINDFSDKVDSNIKIYSMLVPTQIEFTAREKYKDLSSSQKDAIKLVNDKFNDRIEPVDVYSALKDNSDQYLYFRSDHHWTALGAYYAYTSFARHTGEEPVPLDKYEVDKVENYLGSLYSITLDKNVKKSPDTIYLYKPFTEHEYHIYYEGPLKMNVLDMSHATKERKYRIFMSGDRPWGRIRTEIKNGKKIAIIKDSYGNAFVPFLIPHYEEIYIIDPRQFKQNIVTFVEEKEIDEVMFLNYVMVTGGAGFADTIRVMMNN
ncbi:MAG: DHHW family protein [Tissierellales bacterium]